MLLIRKVWKGGTDSHGNSPANWSRNPHSPLLGDAHADSLSVCIFSPTAESFGVSAQIGSGVVRGGHEVRFHEGSTRVPPRFHQGSTRFCEGCGVVRALKSVPSCWGYHLILFWPCSCRGGFDSCGIHVMQQCLRVS